MVLKTPESTLDCKEIKAVNPKGSRHWNIHWKDWRWSWSSNILATWCEEPDSLEKTLMLGKTEGRRRRGQQRMRRLDGIIHLSFRKLWETVKDREAWSAAVHGVAKRRTMSHKKVPQLVRLFLELAISVPTASPTRMNFILLEHRPPPKKVRQLLTLGAGIRTLAFLSSLLWCLKSYEGFLDASPSTRGGH